MIPKPKIKDRVERVDLSRLFGEVLKIVRDKCLISWHDGTYPMETLEAPEDLALVDRPGVKC